MGDIITLDLNDSLLVIRGELVYTKARLLADAGVRDLAAPYDALLTRWSLVYDGQLAVWDAEDVADAEVSAADDDLDDRVTLIINGVAYHYEKGDPTYKRFMGSDTKSRIVRLGLESEIGRVRGWPESLRAVPPLAEHADPLVASLAKGQTALDNRVKANSARADYRIRDLQSFIDDANAQRRTTYHALGDYAVANNRPPSWPKRFFRTRPRHRKAEG